jgi:hypothetical protein
MFLILWRYDFKVNAKLAALDREAQLYSIASRSTELASLPSV